MDEFKEHGGILRDEMLSENLKVTSSGFIEGLVDLGAYTSPEQSMERCDHGLIVLFQPFSSQFQQILGVFGSHSNVKADVLSKIAGCNISCRESWPVCQFCENGQCILE